MPKCYILELLSKGPEEASRDLMRIPRSLYKYSSFIQLKHSNASSKPAVHGITLGDMDAKTTPEHLFGYEATPTPIF